jgi:hypothetical protein
MRKRTELSLSHKREHITEVQFNTKLKYIELTGVSQYASDCKQNILTNVTINYMCDFITFAVGM